MCVILAWLTMRGPSGMPYPAGARKRFSVIDLFGQIAKLSGSLDYLGKRSSIPYSQAR
jgi:hypothetical protein